MAVSSTRNGNSGGRRIAGRELEDAFFLENEKAPPVHGLVTWSWEIPTNTVHYSREWRDILQRPDDPGVQVALSKWWPLVHEDDVQPFLEAARDVVEGVTEDYRTLFRIRREDGEWIWLLSRGRVVEKDAGGKPVRVNGALMDVTFLRFDVKFQHGNPFMSLPRYYAVPDGAGDKAGSDRPQPGGCAAFSPSPAPVTVFPDADAVDAATPDAAIRTFVRKNVEKVFSEGRAIREMVSFATDYGHTVTGEHFFWPEFDEKGAVTGVVSQFWDVTDRLLAERRARLNEKRLDALYHLTQMTSATQEEVLDFVIDSLVKITESKSGFVFFPYNFPGLGGRMVWSKDHYLEFRTDELPTDSLPQDLVDITVDGNGRLYQPVIKNGNCLQPVLELFDGRVKVMRYMVTPVVDGERVVCIAGVRDKENAEYREDDLNQLEAFVNGAWLVLRRHEFVRELQRAKEAAEQANKVKDEFLANISHELRTPLNGILSMLQLLDLMPLNEEEREYVRTANSSGQALLRIISDILDFARIESGKMKLQVEPFDFTSSFESSLGLFRSEAEKRGLGFEVVVGPGIPDRMLGDDGRVRQILFNIVGNALKFTEKGKIRVECSVLPCGKPDSVWIYLAVTDTGIGIPVDQQVRIFDAFTQIDSSPTRKHTGTGLGLSIVRHLVDLMGGSVHAESEPGMGTTIHCSLCFARLPDIPGEAEPALPGGEREREGLHILVVEDDDVSRYALGMFLRRLGHVPVCVRNGRQALEMLQLHPFHCLFTDIQMPDMDGLEVIARIRENRLEGFTPSEETRALLRREMPDAAGHVRPVPRDILAVTVSAHTMKGDRERFLDAGMNFYISKPVAMKDLTDVLGQISALLAGRKA
ncbi:MAG: response regulator [Deltaproteobacteria bacterium]|nr:response regulator [Deltaproteobacteria bacterium]